MLATRIITHRGLDPSRPGYFAESSREAFADQLARGYGLEFDVRLTKDGEIVVIHDTTLKRMTGGKDEREVRELSLTDLLAMDFNGSHLASLTDLLSLIMREQAPDGVSALHLKHAFQEPSALEALLKALQTVDQSKFLLFDVKIETARYLKQSNPAPRLAPSVAHPYDIERFSGATGGTLYTLDEVLAHRDLFDWVWLDEWDTRDAGRREEAALHRGDIRTGACSRAQHRTRHARTPRHFARPSRWGSAPGRARPRDAHDAHPRNPRSRPRRGLY